MSAIRRCFTILAVAWIVCMGRVSPVSGQVRVPDAVSCTTCRLLLTEQLLLRGDERTAPLPGQPLNITTDARGHFWVFFPGERVPWVFDATGRFVRHVGRRGGGPGEFGSAYAAVALPDDSVLVLDSQNRRASLLDRDFRVARTITLSHPLRSVVTGNWPRGVAASHSNEPQRTGWPLHEVSFAGGTTELGRSFGVNRGEYVPGRFGSIIQVLSQPRGGEFWAADIGRYRIAKWRIDGTLGKLCISQPSAT
jgi:hypothetical protein